MKRLLLAAGLLVCGIASALAAGAFNGYPGVGVAPNTNCLSFGNNGVCNQYQPAGPSALTGTETFPADTNYPSMNPATVNVPVSIFAQGMGNAQVVTTNASVAMANGVSTLVSAQATATIALINLPPNPSNNQVVTIANAGSGVLTITAIAVGVGSGQTIVGTAPATLAILTNNAAAAAASSVKYIYQAANTTWYRIQ